MSDIMRRFGVNQTVLALSAARLGDALGNSILFVVLPIFVSRIPSPTFPFPESVRVGMLISLFGIMNAILQPATGIAGDWIGRGKPLVIAGLLVMGVATLLFLFAKDFGFLLLMRGVQGIGLALTVPASLAIMSRVTVKKTRGSAMGVFTTFRLVGFSLGPLVGGYLQEHAGFSASFITGAAAIGVGLALVTTFVHEQRDARGRNADASGASGDGSAGSATEGMAGESGHPKGNAAGLPAGTNGAGRTSVGSYRSLFSPTILAASFSVFAMASSFTMITTLETQINARVGQSALAFGVVFSSLMLSRLAFQVPLGKLSDKVGRKLLIIFGLLLMAPATALLGYPRTTIVLVVLRVLQGIGSAGVAAPALALAGDIAREGGEGRQTSIVTTGFGVGIAVGPLVAGILGTINLQIPFIAGGALLLLAAFAAYFFIAETVERPAREHAAGRQG